MFAEPAIISQFRGGEMIRQFKLKLSVMLAIILVISCAGSNLSIKAEEGAIGGGDGIPAQEDSGGDTSAPDESGDMPEVYRHEVIFKDSVSLDIIPNSLIAVYRGTTTNVAPIGVNGEGKYILENDIYCYRADRGNITFGSFAVDGTDMTTVIEVLVDPVDAELLPVQFYDYVKDPQGTEPKPWMFKFYAAVGSDSAAWGSHNINNENFVTKGLVNNNLNSDGLPVLKDGLTLSDLNASTLDTNKNILFTDDKKMGAPVGFPFDYKDGYYTYDSNLNHVEYQPGATSLIKYNVSSNSNIGSSASIKEYDGFYPLNSIYYDALRDASPTRHSKGVLSPSTKNLLFGMSMTIDFVMPENGKIDGNDMIFEVFGDDDIWMFLTWKDTDGNENSELLLDFGGMHGGALGGSFNFAEQLVNPTIQNPLVVGRQYTMKLFFLERGEYYSRLALRFNLPKKTETPTVTPGVTPEVTPGVTPTVTPEVTPEATPTVTPGITPGGDPEIIIVPTTAIPESEPEPEPEPVVETIPEDEEEDEEPSIEPEIIEDPFIPSGDGNEDEPEADDVPAEEALPQTGAIPYGTVCGVGAVLIGAGALVFGPKKRR